MRNRFFYFNLAGGLSYQGLAFLRVKLQENYEGNPGEIAFFGGGGG